MKYKNTIPALLLALTLLFTGTAKADNHEVITIGVSMSLTGNYAEFGQEQLHGLQMWVDDVNARGMLLGSPVELVYFDDQSSKRRTVEIYEQLINQDKVDLLIGPYSSELTLVASEVAEKYNFPMVSTAASADLIWDRGLKNIFGIDTPSSNYLDLAIEVAKAAGENTIALVYADTEFSRDVARGVRKQAAEQGLRIVLDQQYPENQMDFTGLAQQLAAANADVIMGATYLEDSVALTRALKGAKVKPRMLVYTVGPALREFGDILGADAEGIVGVVQWLRSARVPGGQDFAYRYRQKYGYNPGVHAAMGYSAGGVSEAATRLAGSVDKDAIRSQLGDLTFRSLVGLYEVDATGRQVGKRNYLLQWQENQRRLVEPMNLAERELIHPLP
jgi:branched-chain amino acid transport system substrate-binding protein